jgi:hypothetical protein
VRLLNRRSGPRNSHHHHRDRPLQVHRPSLVLQRNNPRVHQRNLAHQCNRELPLNNRLPECRQAHRECHPLVRWALLLREQRRREQRLLRR